TMDIYDKKEVQEVRTELAKRVVSKEKILRLPPQSPSPAPLEKAAKSVGSAAWVAFWFAVIGAVLSAALFALSIPFPDAGSSFGEIYSNYERFVLPAAAFLFAAPYLVQLLFIVLAQLGLLPDFGPVDEVFELDQEKETGLGQGWAD